MKIICPITRVEEIEKYKDYADSILVRVPHFSSIYEDDLDVDKCIEEIKKYSLEVILCIDKLMHPGDIESIKPFLAKYKDYTFLVGDLGIINLLKDLGVVNHAIYDPKTMVTNHYDLSIYSSLGVKATSMANEIPVKQVIDSYNASNCPIYYQVFGHRLMFYSRRTLISLYGDYLKKDMPLDNLFIRELHRDEKNPVIQNDNGTFVFRSYLISLLGELDNLSFLSYVYLESLFMNNDVYIECLKIYSDFIKGNVSKNESIELLNKLNLDIQDGFTYLDTAYIKEPKPRV